MNASYIGISFKNLPDSPTIVSLKEHYICFTSDLNEACNKVYSFIVNDKDALSKTYHIEKYDVSLDELHYREILPYPINFFTFNKNYKCICNKTNEIVWENDEAYKGS